MHPCFLEVTLPENDGNQQPPSENDAPAMYYRCIIASSPLELNIFKVFNGIYMYLCNYISNLKKKTTRRFSKLLGPFCKNSTGHRHNKNAQNQVTDLYHYSTPNSRRVQNGQLPHLIQDSAREIQTAAFVGFQSFGFIGFSRWWFQPTQVVFETICWNNLECF